MKNADAPAVKREGELPSCRDALRFSITNSPPRAAG